MSKQEAISLFKSLVARYGLHWGANVPAAAYAELDRCNEVLTESDRRAAVGL